MSWVTTSPLTKRLQIKPGQRVLTLGAPDDYRALLDPLPDAVTLQSEPDGVYDIVHLFVRSKADIDQYAPQAIQSTKPGGVLWISYPKGGAKAGTDINRDNGWQTVSDAGWRGVAQISVDETWSALRFRPTDEIGK